MQFDEEIYDLDNKTFLIITKDKDDYNTIGALVDCISHKNITRASCKLKALELLKNHQYDVILCGPMIDNGDYQQVLDESRFLGVLSRRQVFVAITDSEHQYNNERSFEFLADASIDISSTFAELEKLIKNIIISKLMLLDIYNFFECMEYRKMIKACDQYINSGFNNIEIQAYQFKALGLTVLGDIDAAESEYTRFMQDKFCVWPRYGLAKNYFNLHQLDKAEQMLIEVLAKQKNHLDAILLLAKIFMLTNKSVDAIKILTRAVNVFPDNIKLLQTFVDFNKKTNNLDDIKSALEHCLRLSNNSVFKRKVDYIEYIKILIKTPFKNDVEHHKVVLKIIEVFDQMLKNFSDFQEYVSISLTKTDYLLTEKKMQHQLYATVVDIKCKIQDNFTEMVSDTVKQKLALLRRKVNVATRKEIDIILQHLLNASEQDIDRIVDDLSYLSDSEIEKIIVDTARQQEEDVIKKQQEIMSSKQHQEKRQKAFSLMESRKFMESYKLFLQLWHENPYDQILLINTIINLLTCASIYSKVVYYLEAKYLFYHLEKIDDDDIVYSQYLFIESKFAQLKKKFFAT